jgi:hypothetical protein
MIPNIIQSIEDVIKNAAPAEKILWQQIRLLCGENAAIRQVYYQGAIAGSEFLTYQSGKLYLAHELHFNSNNALSAFAASMALYDENNAVNFAPSNMSIIWNTTAAAPNYVGNDLIVKSCYFSRVLAYSYSYMKFSGYKIIFG